MQITKEEARNYLVSYHNLNQNRAYLGTEGIMKCFHQMKSIQYDPLDVVGRNADLVLQSRVSDYKPEMLHELLYQQHVLVDGLDKEMCIYATEEFPYFTRIRKSGSESLKWVLGNRNQTDAFLILDEVREHIRANGLTGSKDISIGESQKTSWGHKKLSSAAMDYMYNTGELSVSEKKGVNKYFDFTENVLPQELVSKVDFATDGEFLKWFICRRIKCVGLLWNKNGGAWQGHYLKNMKMREEVLNQLVESGELVAVSIEGMEIPFYLPAETEHFFQTGTEQKLVKFLAPLDNMIWDRAMTARIFDFEYSWEVYTPVVKRKYGYYVLPVLYGNQIVARMEPEKRNKDTPFSIKNWWWQEDVTVTDEMLEQIHHAIRGFAEYLGVPCKDSYVDEIMGIKTTE